MLNILVCKIGIFIERGFDLGNSEMFLAPVLIKNYRKREYCKEEEIVSKQLPFNGFAIE
jgi:hypothetical protein